MTSIPAASLNRRSPYGLPYALEQAAQKIQMNHVPMVIDDVSETNRGQQWKDYSAEAHNTAVKLVAENEFPGFWEDLLGKASGACALGGLSCLALMLALGSGAITMPLSLVCGLVYVSCEMLRGHVRGLRKQDLRRNEREMFSYQMADSSRWGYTLTALHNHQPVDVPEGLQQAVELPTVPDEEGAEAVADRRRAREAAQAQAAAAAQATTNAGAGAQSRVATGANAQQTTVTEAAGTATRPAAALEAPATTSRAPTRTTLPPVYRPPIAEVSEEPRAAVAEEPQENDGEEPEAVAQGCTIC
jgi:hypothetical protein